MISPEILIAPFSHGDIRDWSAARFREMIGLLTTRFPDTMIRVVGSRSQTWRAAEIVRPFNAVQVRNDCGRFAWPDLVERVRTAMCVVSNNSGLGHLAAAMDVPTICVFGGSHQRHEWRPIGRRSITVSKAVTCSPCHRHRARDCPQALRCLDEIDAATVAGIVASQVEWSAHILVGGD